MNHQHILITGANRGIGLALVREYLVEREAIVTATCRSPKQATDLQALAAAYPKTLSIETLEIDDDTSIAAAVRAVEKRRTPIDILLLNAGTNAKGDQRVNGIGTIDRAAFRGIIETNAVSQVLTAQAFLPLLRPTSGTQASKVVFMSSQMGSIDRAMASRVNAYSVSKAALNMIATEVARELRQSGIPVLTMHPGHVATDMGGPDAPIQPAVSARGIADVISSATIEDSGRFLDWQGKELPW